MKHLAKIQSEFLKEAANWDQLSYEVQKEYLKQHPKSKKRLTAKPVQESKQEENLSLDTIQVVDPREAIESLRKIGVEAIVARSPQNDEIEIKSIKDPEAFAKWFKDDEFDLDVYPKIVEYFKSKNISLE